jgi:hypothetical protein
MATDPKKFFPIKLPKLPARYIEAKPKNAAEKKIMDRANKSTELFWTRDPDGELNARQKHPPGWDSEKIWKRAHPGRGLA